MAFHPDYIMICYHYRSIYKNKTRKIGDWYCNLTTSEIKVYNQESTTDFNKPEWFYIPDMDDLFEFLINQIKACQTTDLPAESIELTFKSEKGWRLEVTLENGLITNSFGGKSPHEVTLQCIYQMSLYVMDEKMETFKNDDPDPEQPKPKEPLKRKLKRAKKEQAGFLADLLMAFKKVGKMLRK